MESPVPSLAPSQSPSSMALCKPDSLRLAVARGPTHWRWVAAPSWTLPSPPLLSSTLSRVRHLRLTCCRLPCCRRPNRYRLNRRRPSRRRFSRLLSHPRPNHLRQSRLRQHHTYPIRCRRPCTNRPRRSRHLGQPYPAALQLACVEEARARSALRAICARSMPWPGSAALLGSCDAVWAALPLRRPPLHRPPLRRHRQLRRRFPRRPSRRLLPCWLGPSSSSVACAPSPSSTAGSARSGVR
jgi:hypothetical protein